MEEGIIKYKEFLYTDKSLPHTELWRELEYVPTKVIEHNGNTIYYIVPSKRFKSKFCLHKVDGPAFNNYNIHRYFYYGYESKDEKEFYDYEWRRLIEIKAFI